MEFFTIGSATHIGMKKKENQDYHAYYSPEEGSRKGTLLALADGMGGRRGGALASKIAVDVLMEAYYKDMSSRSIPEILENAFQKANRTVIEKGQDDINLQGMATTLTAVVLKGNRMYYAHVGDSRGYTIHRHRIIQFTEDHSYVADLVRAGQISEEEAASHPERNLITRAIGLNTELTVDAPLKPRSLKKNQYVLLCCDGLHGVVPKNEILDAVRQYRSPDAISEKLVEKANERGGPDNITVLIARVDKITLMSRCMNLVR